MDRYTLKPSAELDAAYGGADHFLRRAELADQAWDAYQAAGGRASGRSLADFQQDAIDAEVARCTEARHRNANSWQRIQQATYGPASGTGELDHDNPDSLEAHGMHFTAARLRRERAQADHASRRQRVDTEVARHDRLHATLRRNYGTRYADQFMGGGDAA
jgi:hypothetical protein